MTSFLTLAHAPSFALGLQGLHVLVTTGTASFRTCQQLASTSVHGPLSGMPRYLGLLESPTQIL